MNETENRRWLKYTALPAISPYNTPSLPTVFASVFIASGPSMLCYVYVGPYARDRNGAPTPPHRARGPPRRTPNAHSGSGVKISPSAIRLAGVVGAVD